MLRMTRLLLANTKKTNAMAYSTQHPSLAQALKKVNIFNQIPHGRDERHKFFERGFFESVKRLNAMVVQNECDYYNKEINNQKFNCEFPRHSGISETVLAYFYEHGFHGLDIDASTKAILLSHFPLLMMLELNGKKLREENLPGGRLNKLIASFIFSVNYPYNVYKIESRSRSFFTCEPDFNNRNFFPINIAQDEYAAILRMILSDSVLYQQLNIANQIFLLSTAKRLNIQLDPYPDHLKNAIAKGYDNMPTFNAESINACSSHPWLQLTTISVGSKDDVINKLVKNALSGQSTNDAMGDPEASYIVLLKEFGYVLNRDSLLANALAKKYPDIAQIQKNHMTMQAMSHAFDPSCGLDNIEDQAKESSALPNHFNGFQCS